MAQVEPDILEAAEPPEVEETSVEKIDYYEASQISLMWRRFRKHKVALWMFHVVIVLYLLCLNANFFSPYDPTAFHTERINCSPQVVKFGFVEGSSIPGPYVNPMVMRRDLVTRRPCYEVDTSKRQAISFFVKGREWHFLGLIPTNIHFFGVKEGECFLLGTDELGRDMFSRLLYGGRISLLLGLTGVFLSFTLGITLGGISGYYGGKIDMLIQRVAEMLQSVPKIPIWLALAAAIPRGFGPIAVYFMMTLILACMGWTGMCRVVRGKLLSLRQEDYARAALLAGASERRVIFVHLVPNFASHIVASLTLAVPGMILAETSLSFLGLGLRPPVVSWGVLLQGIQVDTVVNQPWLLLPAVMVIIAVLSFNFAGEGLRDAADPYSK